jgi:AraC-like DNA-binding protein/CheY-like chemotaxis protein
VNFRPSGPDGISRIPFERLFRLKEIDSSELDGDAAAQQWDAVCCNFDYPDMAGLRLIPEAKSRWPSAPILMLTLQASAELAMWALRSRVFDLLVKPPAEREIERMLERVVHAVRARHSQMERKPQVMAAQLPTETRYVPHSTTAARLQGAIALVANQYLRPIHESEVALLCNMSPSRFCHEFKATFAVTFVEYLAHYRMERAKRLLANPTMSVADVAVSVGFNDPSYFTRVFRKQEGLSPSEYRANTIFEANSRPHPAPSQTTLPPAESDHDTLPTRQPAPNYTATETSPFGWRLPRFNQSGS